MHDLVIKGGNVVDGTGAPGRSADIAITDGIVTEIGRIKELTRETIDADGALVTPGFVDPHTHFDGQVTWDPMLTPTCWHGVTTVVMGNCGVGFAPCDPTRRDWLIGLMEGVEDIPGAALSEGIEWEWESFPEYLDAVERKPLLFDVGTQVPHGAVRGYVMGERGAKNEPATAEDIEQMAALVKAGIEAGALGFSTSRTIAHMAIDGEPVPGTFAAEDELFGIGAVLGELGTGVFELAPAGALGEDLAAPEREMEWMRELAAAIGRPITFALTQNDHDPDSWSRMLELCAQAAADGAPVTPQVAGRPVSLLLGLQTFHPFAYCPSWAPIGGAPLAEKVAAMRNPELRRKLLAEVDAAIAPMRQFLDPERAFPFGDLPDYEQPSRASERRRSRPRAGPRRDGSLLRRVAAGRRQAVRHASVAQLFGLLARRGARHALAPHDRLGPRRRRRALRYDLRREHADVHAHALGPRSRARHVAGRVRREQDDRADGGALRPRRPGCARAGDARRRERHRLRRAAAAVAGARARPPRGCPPLRTGFEWVRRDDQARHRDPP